MTRLAASLALLIFPTPMGCGPKSGPPPPAEVPVHALGWAHVKDRTVVDEYGRELLLRGVNVKARGLFDVSFDDGRLPNEVVPTFDATDAADIESLGFNFVRVTLNWSGLEPTEGVFAKDYLAELDRVVHLCTQAGLYVLLDFHQDSWGKDIGEDGAPLWATLPGPQQLLGGPVYAGPGLPCPCGSLDARRSSAAALAAFESFFTNAQSLQDRFIPAWTQVASRYAGEAGVIGFEDMNEPVALHIANGTKLLEAFHEKSVRALRSVDPRHAIWVEPEAVGRYLTLTAPSRSSPFEDDNVVYAPHLYPLLARTTADEWKAALSETFSSMVREAHLWNGAVVLGEWGGDLHQASSVPYANGVYALADELNIGTAVWVWKEYGAWGSRSWDSSRSGWVSSQPGLDAIARPYPMAVPGRLVRNFLDLETGALSVTFEAVGDEAAPVLSLPAQRFPNGLAIELDGVAVEVPVDPSTPRLRVPWNRQPGPHTIVVRRL